MQRSVRRVFPTTIWTTIHVFGIHDGMYAETNAAKITKHKRATWQTRKQK